MQFTYSYPDIASCLLEQNLHMCPCVYVNAGYSVSLLLNVFPQPQETFYVSSKYHKS